MRQNPKLVVKTLNNMIFNGKYVIKKIFFTILIGLSLNINVYAKDEATSSVKSLPIECRYDQAKQKHCTLFDIQKNLVISIDNGFWAMRTFPAHQPRFLQSVQIDDHPPIRSLLLNGQVKEAIEEMKQGEKITVTILDELYGIQIYTSNLTGSIVMFEQLQQTYDQF